MYIYSFCITPQCNLKMDYFKFSLPLFLFWSQLSQGGQRGQGEKGGQAETERKKAERGGEEGER